jgi:UDP-N-acetyl-D-galactosamine dehydrogenase
LIISGIGKSGIVGRKIVATLNSTGTRSLFLHPVEAMHEYDETLMPSLDSAGGYDCVIGAVPHAPYLALSKESLSVLVRDGGLVADIKGSVEALSTIARASQL